MRYRLPRQEGQWAGDCSGRKCRCQIGQLRESPVPRGGTREAALGPGRSARKGRPGGWGTEFKEVWWQEHRHRPESQCLLKCVPYVCCWPLPGLLRGLELGPEWPLPAPGQPWSLQPQPAAVAFKTKRRGRHPGDAGEGSAETLLCTLGCGARSTDCGRPGSGPLCFHPQPSGGPWLIHHF